MIGSEGTPVYLIIGLICLIMPAITWVILAEHRSPAVTYWCGGNLLFAMGLLLAWGRSGHGGWSTLPLANLLALEGILLGVQALRQVQGIPWHLGTLALGSLGYLVAYEGLRQTLRDTPLQQAFVTLAWLVLVAELAARGHGIFRRQRSPGALAIAVTEALLAATLLVHLGNLALDWRAGFPVPHLLKIELLGAVAVLAILVSDVGFIGIVLERLVAQWLESAADQARQEERRRLEGQLAHLDRQRGWGLVAASLAHELNQPLTAILASAQTAQRGAAAQRLAPAEHLALLEKVILNARRISGITERIRTFIRPAVPARGPVDLVQVVREVQDLLGPDLQRHGVAVSWPPGSGPVLVEGDPIQLAQVVLNVLRNALDAVQAAPQRSIQIQVTEAAGEAVLTIRDSGPGLDAAAAAQVGTPYFTTKAQGLGLGLSICTEILRVHQGSLSLVNAPEGGACVAIRMPRLVECAP